MTDEKVLFPVRKERSGHGIPPAECPGTARRYTVTRIRFHHHNISVRTLQETMKKAAKKFPKKFRGKEAGEDFPEGILSRKSMLLLFPRQSSGGSGVSVPAAAPV